MTSSFVVSCLRITSTGNEEYTNAPAFVKTILFSHDTSIMGHVLTSAPMSRHGIACKLGEKRSSKSCWQNVISSSELQRIMNYTCEAMN